MEQMYKKLKLTTISELIKNIYCSLSVLIIGCASAYAVEFNKDLIEAKIVKTLTFPNLKLMANYP